MFSRILLPSPRTNFLTKPNFSHKSQTKLNGICLYEFFSHQSHQCKNTSAPTATLSQPDTISSRIKLAGPGCVAPGRAGVGGQDCPPQNFGDFLGHCDQRHGRHPGPHRLYTFMMPAGIRNHSKHPMVSDPYNGPIPTSIPTRN